MKKYYLITALCASLSISGCDHYSTKMAMMEQSNTDVSAIAPASGGEMTFSGYLAAQYYQLASHEQNVTRDYPAAKNYFTKAETLSAGQMVALDPIDNNISNVEKAALVEARQQIETALHQYNIPENRYALALAHSRYDCWVDESAEDKGVSSCKIHFQQAMNSLVEPYSYSEDDFYDDFFDVEL